LLQSTDLNIKTNKTVAFLGKSHCIKNNAIVSSLSLLVGDCIHKSSASFETMGQTYATKLEKHAEQGATQTCWQQAGRHKVKRVSNFAIKSRHPARRQDGKGIARDMHAAKDAKSSCYDGISSLVQVTNATTASKDGTCKGTNSISAPAHAPKTMKNSSLNKRQASLIPKQRGAP
jgi:hypothetical protein